MDDPVDARECAIGRRVVADVALDQLDRIRNVRRHLAVDLRVERVEHDDVVASLEQLLDEVRANEARTACDQSLHAAKHCRKAGFSSLANGLVGGGRVLAERA